MTFQSLNLQAGGCFLKGFRIEKDKPVVSRSGRIKRLVLVFFVCVAAFSMLGGASVTCDTVILSQQQLAAEGDKTIEDMLNDAVNDQLENLDTEGFEDFLNGLGKEQYELFGGNSFGEKLRQVLSGEFSDGYNNFFSAFFSLIFGQVLNFLPTFLTMTAIALVLGLLSNMKPNFLSKGMGEVIYFACYAVMIVVMLAAVMQVMQVAKSAMDSMKAQMNAVFPVLLTLTAGLGGVVSVKVYQPAVAALSAVVLNVITTIIFPLFVVSMVLSVVSNMSGGVRLSKLTDAVKSVANWIIGITFTIFLAFLSVQGITAAVHDGVSIRAAKYAISNSIPVIGGYIKDSFELIISGTMLIKNALGVTGLILLIATLALPFIKILAFMLGLKITAAVIEPMSDGRISGFVSASSKSLSMVLVSVIGTAFMYFITVMLLICSSNPVY